MQTNRHVAIRNFRKSRRFQGFQTRTLKVGERGPSRFQLVSYSNPTLFAFLFFGGLVLLLVSAMVMAFGLGSRRFQERMEEIASNPRNANIKPCGIVTWGVALFFVGLAVTGVGVTVNHNLGALSNGFYTASFLLIAIGIGMMLGGRSRQS